MKMELYYIIVSNIFLGESPNIDNYANAGFCSKHVIVHLMTVYNDNQFDRFSIIVLGYFYK